MLLMLFFHYYFERMRFMKKMKRFRKIRTLILSALLIASLTCTSGVMRAYAAEGTESPGSDAAEEFSVEDERILSNDQMVTAARQGRRWYSQSSRISRRSLPRFPRCNGLQRQDSRWRRE